jgi:hypothetical protein
MPTISADRALKAAAALLLLGASGIARAGPTIEIDPKTEAFADRGACEQALKQRRSAALSRLDSLSPAEKRSTSVSELKRGGGDHLSYAEKVELVADEPGSEMPRSQTEQFTCRGSLLEHRIDFGMGGR